MNPKAKKGLIIAGLAFDIFVTIALFVFSIIFLVNVPDSKFEISELNPFLGWFYEIPTRFLLIVVLPLLLLLFANVFFTVVYIRKTGENTAKKKVTLDDLTDEEKEALRRKILQEMLEKDSNK